VKNLLQAVHDLCKVGDILVPGHPGVEPELAAKIVDGCRIKDLLGNIVRLCLRRVESQQPCGLLALKTTEDNLKHASRLPQCAHPHLHVDEGPVGLCREQELDVVEVAVGEFEEVNIVGPHADIPRFAKELFQSNATPCKRSQAAVGLDRRVEALRTKAVLRGRRGDALKQI